MEVRTMAVHKYISHAAPAGSVVVDGATIRIMGPVALEAPKAAAFLGDIADDHRAMVVEELLEHGAAAAAAIQTSAHVVMLEAKLAELTTKFRADLDELLKTSGANSVEAVQNLLVAHKVELTALVAPLFDTNAKNGLPAKMVELLDAANRNAMHHIDVMLKDGEEGAIGKAVTAITAQIKATEVTITSAVAAREALLTRSNLRGTRFEDVLAVRLPIVVRAMGHVEHCAKVPGDKARNAGDYLVTLDGTHAGEEVKIVVEAKSHKNRFSANEIRKELRLARSNRGARAAVFVAESAEILPDGVGFGQVGECDFYVAFDPAVGDETCLSCALYMAKAVALASATVNGGEQVDVAAVQREVAGMRSLLQQFSKIEACHSKVDKEIGNARTYAADLKADIVSALRRLDDLLTP
jgi:hypothetical protein